ncbi:hypothetical protein FB451DRAFT_1033108 [Mycena latifolia]|nr:hypothetical protein FB451DRAFT_1033108 [Mycena latifolia]
MKFYIAALLASTTILSPLGALAAVAAPAALAVPAVNLTAPTTDLTSAVVVTSITTITTLSSTLSTKVTVITTTSSPDAIISLGNYVVTAFTAIIAQIRILITSIASAPGFTFNDVDAGPIVVALVAVRVYLTPATTTYPPLQFVKVHQALLSVIFGKYSILAKFPITAPIAAILQVLEGVVDTLAFGLIGLIPTRSDACKQAQLQLDASLSVTITKYSCIPIPFFKSCN